MRYELYFFMVAAKTPPPSFLSLVFIALSDRFIVNNFCAKNTIIQPSFGQYNDVLMKAAKITIEIMRFST